MQNDGDAIDVRYEARDVGHGREGADAQSPRGGIVPRQAQQSFQFDQIDDSFRGFGHGDHLAPRLPPGQQVRVMLVRPHEHHRPLLATFVILVRLHYHSPEVEAVDQYPHRTRDPVPTEDHSVDRRLARDSGACAFADDLAGLGDERRRLTASVGDVRVGVGVARHGRTPQVILDGGHGTLRRGLIAVHEGDGHAPVGRSAARPRRFR
mmetsp:Transcript_919/g.2051  ORF Transcript_919/g.2051 Transcript_919/m.2051 type:complete len:208 (-) Transcript_919:307-930(-)